MAQTQTNGFKTIRQSYGDQNFDITLDGSQSVVLSGQNIIGAKGLLRTYSGLFTGFGPEHPFDQTYPQELYTYENEVEFFAYSVYDEQVIYNHEVASFNVNPFKAVIPDEYLSDYIVTIDEAVVYGSGKDWDNYNTVSFDIVTSSNFPQGQAISTNPLQVISWRNTIVPSAELDGLQVRANSGDIKVSILVVAPTGTPVDPDDNRFKIRYKLTARKIFNI